MAIYHFSGTIISRSQGRSAVACAAYRSGEQLKDERYEKEHDYTRKKDVVYKEVLLPKNAPEWMEDREKLWNAVEAAEKRKDAQLSREFNFALPRELTLEQNTELARTFIQEQFVEKGMVADLCIHADKNPEGEYLYHAHVMLTLREVTEQWFGQKVREWNEKSKLLEWREAWANDANKALALNGHDLRIDHRTLEAQGIDLEPQTKIGPEAARSQMVRLEEHQRIARENGERLLSSPEIAFKVLTQQQSTFTHQDIARFVNRHTVDAEQFERVYEVVKGFEGIVRLGVDEQQRERFTTQEMLKLETEMLSNAKALAKWDGHYVIKSESEIALQSRSLSVEQKGVFDYLIEPESLRCVVGYAGTGKSYLLGAAREAWETSGYRVLGATLSGIAAQTLEGSSGIESRTLASRCYYWDRGQEKLKAKDILVVDEAGMLGSRQMGRVLEEAEQSGAKVVLVGDVQQLQAIQAGAAFRAIVEQSHFVELTEVRRQKTGWQQEATKEFARGKVAEALQRYEKASHLHEYQTQALAKTGLIELWNDVRLTHPEQTQILLAYTRADVQELNERARECRKAEEELGQEALFTTTRGQRFFAENDRIYFLKNDRDLRVMNGSLGTIAEIKRGEIIVLLDKEGDKLKSRKVSINLNFYNQLDHGYAATIHKAQGVTVDRAYVLGSKYFDAHSAYVGMSRHRTSVDLFWSREEFPHYSALIQTFSWDRGKDVSLDYLGDSSKKIYALDNALIKTTELARNLQRTEDLSHSHKHFSDSFVDPLKAIKQKAQDLNNFKAQFESQNPERAKELLDAIRPGYEKAALLVEKQFLELEKGFERDPSKSSLLDQMKTQACLVSKQPEVMDYLKRSNPELSQKIERLAKPEPEKTKVLEKTRELERGFER